MQSGSLWTKEELIVVLNLYWKIPYNKISGSSNEQIKAMSHILGRTPASIAYKLMNFTSLDPERQIVGNKGKSSVGNLDHVVWSEYFNKWEELSNDTIDILSKIQSKPLEQILSIENEIVGLTGKEKERLVRVRVNQADFRQRVLASYNEQCCFTGINIPSLLVASHIIPWSLNDRERLNPKNGLCLNVLHDKAFDRGLLTVTPDYRIKISKKILNKTNEAVCQEFFLKFDQKIIQLPDRYLPDSNFLIWHNSNVFEKF